MGTKAETLQRREQISLVLAKSITTPTAISQQTGIKIEDVKNDLRWMKKAAKTTLSGHALDGYIFETKNTIDQLKDIEHELQSLRTKETDLDKKIKILHELKEVINMRWVIHGDGLTLLAQKFKDDGG
jgi:DNA-binding CsgD family transcriptional regulator